MKFTILIENTAGTPGCTPEHGLSILIRTEKHLLLSDAGATDAFIHNADVLHEDLRKADTVILSHGHYDHCGGILAFHKLNPDAPIYLRSSAYGAFYNGEGKFIGIDPAIRTLPSLHLTDGSEVLDDELSLFTGVTARRLFPLSNRRILKEENGSRVMDDFGHEQYLVIREKGRYVLVSGCAHNGIINILDRFRTIYGTDPDAVISGFHMMKKTAYTDEEIRIAEDTARELSGTKTVFFTGHCTGEQAIDIMKDIMGDRLRILSTGFRGDTDDLFS